MHVNMNKAGRCFIVHWERENRNIKGSQSKVMLIMYEDYRETFFLPPSVGVAALVCLRSLMKELIWLNYKVKLSNQIIQSSSWTDIHELSYVHIE